MKRGVGFVALLLVATSLAMAADAGARRRPRRPGCGASCRNLGGVGGDFGACVPDQPSPLGSGDVSDSTTMKVNTASYAPKGDVLLAAVESAGSAVSPPHGWKAVPGTDYTGTGERVQVFYKVAAQREPASYSFTSAVPQRMFAALYDFFGVDPKHPIDTAAGQVNSAPSAEVGAPSITPTETDTMLVLVGATNVSAKWRAPSGMRLQDVATYSHFTQSFVDNPPIGVAIERWHPAAASGTRTATIASPNRSIGELISLNYLKPITCPKVKILSRKFKATSDGLVFARVKCVWTARCNGAFEGIDMEDQHSPGKIAASDFSIGAGKTRTIAIALTKAGAKALKARRKLAFDVFVWVFAPAGQPVVAGAGAYKITI